MSHPLSNWIYSNGENVVAMSAFTTLDRSVIGRIHDVSSGSLIYEVVGSPGILEIPDDLYDWLEKRSYNRSKSLLIESPRDRTHNFKNANAYYDLGRYRIFPMGLELCQSSLERKFFIWDSEESRVVHELNPIYMGPLVQRGFPDCEKFNDASVEELDYLGLWISGVWQISDDKFAITFGLVPNVVIFDANNPQFFVKKSGRIAFIKSSSINDIYSAHKDKCIGKLKSEAVTLDSCINSAIDVSKYIK